MVGVDPPEPDGAAVVRASLRTSDLDEARQYCRRLFYDTVRVRPLGDTAGLRFAADGLRIGAVTVGEIAYGTDVSVTAPDLRTAYHVIAPLTGVVQCRQLGDAVAADPSSAVVLRPVGEVELTLPADCRLLSVKVDRSALERAVDAAVEREVSSPMPLGACFATGSGPGRSWMALLRLLLTESRGPDALLDRPSIAHRWQRMLIGGLALTVDHPYAPEPAMRRPRTVKRTLDAMHADPAHPYTAGELAGIAGVGVRVLQESFRQHVGMSPMTYLRRLRLDGVRGELAGADPWQVSVSEVATRWGFSHLGRFAGAYRARFGESPSKTLRDRR